MLSILHMCWGRDSGPHAFTASALQTAISPALGLSFYILIFPRVYPLWKELNLFLFSSFLTSWLLLLFKTLERMVCTELFLPWSPPLASSPALTMKPRLALDWPHASLSHHTQVFSFPLSSTSFHFTFYFLSLCFRTLSSWCVRVTLISQMWFFSTVFNLLVSTFREL